MRIMNSSEMLESLTNAAEPFYSKIVVTLVILLLGLFIGRFIGRLVTKILGEVELNKIYKLATGYSSKLDKIIGKIVSYLIYFIFGMWALENVGLSSVTLNIIAGGIVVLIIIAVIFAIKDFIPNVFAGMFIHIKGIIKEGDEVEIDNVKGIIKSIGLVETKLYANGSDLIYVPNSAFVRSRQIRIKNAEERKKTTKAKKSTKE